MKIKNIVHKSLRRLHSDDISKALPAECVPKLRNMLANLQERPTMPMRNPPHPGCFVRDEILEPLHLTVTAAARVLGVSRPALSNLLNGHANLSGEMAMRIEKAFGVNMDTLLRMQLSYDIALTRKQEKKIKVNRYVSDQPNAGALAN